MTSVIIYTSIRVNNTKSHCSATPFEIPRLIASILLQASHILFSEHLHTEIKNSLVVYYYLSELHYLKSGKFREKLIFLKPGYVLVRS